MNRAERGLPSAPLFSTARIARGTFPGIFCAPDADLKIHIYADCDMLLCMRTTIEINDELFRRAKRRAADEAGSLRSVVESALRSYLGGSSRRQRYKLRWRPKKGRVLPGVKLDDRDALFDVMDGRF